MCRDQCVCTELEARRSDWSQYCMYACRGVIMCDEYAYACRGVGVIMCDEYIYACRGVRVYAYVYVCVRVRVCIVVYSWFGGGVLNDQT